MTRFRPRFSVRTLAIFVTLVCAYFGAWEATKRFGVPKGNVGHRSLGDAYAAVINAWSPVPFLIICNETSPFDDDSQRYYLWLFGPTIKLPFESELHDRNALIPMPPDTFIGFPPSYAPSAAPS